MNFNVGDIVQLKKQHPCGCFDWEVLRVGADFRIKCTKCGRMVMLGRGDFEKGVKKIIKSNDVWLSINPKFVVAKKERDCHAQRTGSQWQG